MSKPHRKGIFVGAYVPRYIKEELQRRATAKRGSSISQELIGILRSAIKGPGVETDAAKYERKYNGSTKDSNVN